RPDDEDVAGPGAHRLRDLQGRVPIATGFGETEDLPLVRGVEGRLHPLQDLAPFALGGQGAGKAALRAGGALPRLRLRDLLAQEPGDQRLLGDRSKLDAGAAR